jgi:hypothetical protein
MLEDVTGVLDGQETFFTAMSLPGDPSDICLNLAWIAYSYFFILHPAELFQPFNISACLREWDVFSVAERPWLDQGVVG